MSMMGGDEPWNATKEEILAKMQKTGDWYSFSEYDNTKAVMDLIQSGDIELDQSHNNRVSGMVTSLRARATKKPAPTE